MAEHTAPTDRIHFTQRAQAPGHLQLRVLDGVGAPRTIEINKPLVSVGRSERADEIVDHGSISGRHFELEARASAVEVRDLGSTNGLWFGGRRVTSVVLEAADEFHAGSCRFVVERVGERSVKVLVREKFCNLLGASVVMRELYAEILKFADAPLGVLLLGETGTGKELTAQALHTASKRSGPLVVLDCSTLTPSLVEARLFGVRAGAYTGAEHDRVGCLEQADGGTLFIDEVGELPRAMQSKLLRVLEDGRIARVGESTPSARIDVRVIAATNADLRAAIEDGERFLSAVYQRLAGVVIHLPRLRDRGDDIVMLAEHFLAEVARTRGASIEIGEDAWAVLRRYPWPGNVRELRNTIIRAAYGQSGGVIKPEDLRLGARRQVRPDRVEHMIEAGVSLDEIKARVEAMYMTRMLELHDDLASIADAMGTSRSTVRRRLQRAGIYEGWTQS